MKKLLILIGVVALVGVIAFVSVKNATRRGAKVYEEEVKKVESISSTVKASGEIQPKVYVNISSQVPGQIVELRVKEGDQVRKGDVLLQLDPAQYHSSVVRLEANLRMAGINLEREKASLATYENTLRRQEALATSEIVSAEALDQSGLQAKTSRIQVQALEEQILQADADLVKSRDELQKTTIRAPIEGLVTMVNAKLGEQVIIGTMNNPGTVILVLSDMSEMLAAVKVDETEVASVREGQKAAVRVDALEERKFDGVVTEIAHTAVKERDVSRFTVKVALSSQPGGAAPMATREIPVPVNPAPPYDAQGELRPGMSAHASIEVASKRDALVVPIQAVITKKRKEVEDLLKQQSEGGSGSLAAEDSNKAVVRPREVAIADEEVDLLFVDRGGKVEMLVVKTGLSDEFSVEIVDPVLQPGDKVVIGPYRTLKKLKPGDAVIKVEKDEELKGEEP